MTDRTESFDKQLAEAVEYGRSLTKLPLKKEIVVKWVNEKPIDEWETGYEPPAIHTCEDFAHTLMWINLKPELGGPEPKLIDVNNYIINNLKPELVLEIWEAYFGDDLYYRPDYLVAIVAEAIKRGLSRVFDDLPDYVFTGYRFGFSNDLDQAEKVVHDRLIRPIS